jgi:hypothetical protein
VAARINLLLPVTGNCTAKYAGPTRKAEERLRVVLGLTHVAGQVEEPTSVNASPE